MRLDPNSSEWVVKSFARRVMRRVSLSKLREITLEDVEQECWVAWCKARDSFNPQLGVPFNAYLQRGLRMHVNRWLDSYAREDQIAHRSIHDTSGSDNDRELGEILDGQVEFEPAQDCLLVDLAERILSDRAKIFIRLLSSPTKELFEQIDRVADRAAFARDRGIVTAAPTRITTRLIFDLMGCGQHERNRIMGELKAFAAEFNK